MADDGAFKSQGGANPNAFCSKAENMLEPNALQLACWAGHASLAEELIRLGADVSFSPMLVSPLILHIVHGPPSISNLAHTFDVLRLVGACRQNTTGECNEYGGVLCPALRSLNPES